MDVKTYMVDPTSGMCIIPRGHLEGQEYEMVLVEDFDRVTAERDALQLRLNAVEEENDRLRQMTDVDALSNIIRAADGNHNLGAGALAEKIIEALEKRL